MKKGILYSFAAYLLWGFFPVYFKFLQDVSAGQILAHRITWSFVILLVIILIRRDLVRLVKSLTRRNLLIYLAAGLLLSINWLTYVWAVTSGQIVEGSLGYFINPLVSVMLGVVFLREKLRLWQWLPVGLATLGVAYLTISLGQLPWISLLLAFTFGLYGLIKKVAPLESVHGLTVETALIVLPALGYLLFLEARGAGSFGHASAGISLLLTLAGPVTVLPLIFFASGARMITLSLLGFLQYISPTIQFLIGVLIYHEPFSADRVIGFAIIWLALIIFTVEGFVHQRRGKVAQNNQQRQIEESALP